MGGFAEPVRTFPPIRGFEPQLVHGRYMAGLHRLPELGSVFRWNQVQSGHRSPGTEFPLCYGPSRVQSHPTAWGKCNHCLSPVLEIVFVHNSRNSRNAALWDGEEAVKNP